MSKSLIVKISVPSTSLYETLVEDKHTTAHVHLLSLVCFHTTTQTVGKASRNYADILYHARLLTIKLLEPGSFAKRFKSSLKQFYSGHDDLVDRYGISISTIRIDVLTVS